MCVCVCVCVCVLINDKMLPIYIYLGTYIQSHQDKGWMESS